MINALEKRNVLMVISDSVPNTKISLHTVFVVHAYPFVYVACQLLLIVLYMRSIFLDQIITTCVNNKIMYSKMFCCVSILYP